MRDVKRVVLLCSLSHSLSKRDSVLKVYVIMSLYVVCVILSPLSLVSLSLCITHPKPRIQGTLGLNPKPQHTRSIRREPSSVVVGEGNEAQVVVTQY